jgi:SAM-dependent methyltransferase
MKSDNTTVASFWNQIYNSVDDGGYISNDTTSNRYRFLYEKKELISFIEKYTKLGTRTRALDVGCGNGRFSKVLAKYFANVDAIDLSEDIISKNKIKNKIKNCHFYPSSLEDFLENTKFKYDFVYIGGVLMYIEDDNLLLSSELVDSVLKKEAILILRESVMTKKRVDNISEKYIAYYRHKDKYIDFSTFKLYENRENVAYRTSELKILLTKLKLKFLFHEKLYQNLFFLLRIKNLLWKPKLNKLVNYYYIFRGKDI